MALIADGDNLPDDIRQALGDGPVWVVFLHFPQITVIADMVSGPRLVDVSYVDRSAADLPDQTDRFEEGATVFPAAADIVNLSAAWVLEEFPDKTGHIEGVDIVADLFPMIAKDGILLCGVMALHKIVQEAVQLDPAMVRAGETATAQAAGGQAKVASVFLHHNIRSDLRGSKEGVLALVDGEGFRDSFGKSGIGEIPAGFLFHEGDRVGPVAIDLVGGEMDKNRLRGVSANRLKQIEGSSGIDIKIIKRDLGGQIVGWLGGGVHDQIRLFPLEKGEDGRAITDVEGDVMIIRKGVFQTLPIPEGIAGGTKEGSPLIVIDADNPHSLPGKENGDFRAN